MSVFDYSLCWSSVLRSCLPCRWEKLDDKFVNKVQQTCYGYCGDHVLKHLLRRYHFKHINVILRLLPDYFSCNSLMLNCAMLSEQFTNSKHCSLTNVQISCTDCSSPYQCNIILRHKSSLYGGSIVTLLSLKRNM